MKKTKQKYFRIMSVAPSTIGFGYAVFEGQETLVECDIKAARGDDKNVQVLRKVQKLIVHFQPDVLVLENINAKISRRSKRIKMLNQEIIAMTKVHKIKVKLFLRAHVMKALIPDGKGTKQAVAQIIAQRFPEQLATQLPPERKLWNAESPRMAMFDAVALGVFWLRQ